ncbi:hypothetical protein TB1_032225 [Malus domestica]
MEVTVESRARERSFGKVVNVNDRDEELALFLEMRRREKDKEKNAGFLLLPPNKNADELDPIAAAVAPPESDNRGGAAVSRTVGAAPPPQPKIRVDEFLNSENEKSDYDWLLTPPATPLFSSLDMEVQKTTTNQSEITNDRASAPKSRLANNQLESASRNKITSKQPTLPSGLNSSSSGNRRPSSPATRRSATPTGRSTLPSTTKPSRSSTPNSRATLSSPKPVAPPVRSSTPSRSTARSSTPTGRPSAPTTRPSAPASRSTSRPATPTHRPSSSSSSSAAAVSAPPGRSSSASKLRPTSSKNPVSSRGSSPTVKPRPLKSSEIPGFSHDAPPTLRTSVPQRPASASRDRPGAPSVKSSSVMAGSNGKPRQQSCSPSRARASNVSTTTNGNSHRVISRSSSHDNDDVNPVLIGTQMVERVVNSRKLAPPKHYDHHNTDNGSGGKSSSSESSGFGRNLSKKSIDMAMRHMDIRRSMPGNLRPVLTNVPASSGYSVRIKPTKSNTTGAMDSPLATCSNASSEPSVNNIPLSLEGCEIEAIDPGSERGNSSCKTPS